jgi:phosphonopyruvate decarboxylase
MLDPAAFYDQLSALGYRLCSGVPCSFLRGLIDEAVARGEYVAASGEAEAAAICAGAWLGGTKAALLAQNSGLANAVSPLTSLHPIFNIPLLGFVSLRGEQGIGDEPQHDLMGRITTDLLELLGIRWSFLPPVQDQAWPSLGEADALVEAGQSFFFVVKKGTFGSGPGTPS